MNGLLSNTRGGIGLKILGILLLIGVVATAGYLLAGVGDQRGESQYTGHVVDVVEDKGIVFTPTWANMKTNPRSSDKQQYCIRPDDEDEFVPQFYDAMESGDRYTVTYERPFWVSPSDCPDNAAIITDIQPAGGNGTNGA